MMTETIGDVLVYICDSSGASSVLSVESITFIFAWLGGSVWRRLFMPEISGKILVRLRPQEPHFCWSCIQCLCPLCFRLFH
jgi:hypothetical protein